MQLAGEAGSLLRIEADIADAVAEAKKQWLTRAKAEQLTLRPEDKRPTVEQLGLFDVSGITDEEFWHQAEGRVLDLLQTYARHAPMAWDCSGNCSPTMPRGVSRLSICAVSNSTSY